MANNRQHKRTETQNIKNKISPAGGDVPQETVKSELEKRIVDDVKKLAKGFTVSVYALIEIGKELNALEEQMEREAENAAMEEKED